MRTVSLDNYSDMKKSREVTRFITFFGTALYLNTETNLLSHGRIGVVPNNVVGLRDADKLALYFRDEARGELHPISELNPHQGCFYAGRDRGSAILQIGPMGQERMTISRDGWFLSAEPTGLIGMFRILAGHWEVFLAVSDVDYDELAFVSTHCWLQGAPSILLRPTDIEPTENFIWKFGGDRIPIETLLSLARSNQRPSKSLQILAMHDTWKVTRLRLYNPLVYLTAYGKDEIFQLAQIAITALVEHEWPGEIHLLTDHKTIDFTPQFANSKDIFESHIVPAHDILDFALARYKITETGAHDQFQPILYIDTDVACDSDLSDLLKIMCFSDDLYALFEGDLMVPEDHYGRTLFENDPGIATEGKRGFSTGILGFRNTSIVRDLFQTIVAHAYTFAMKSNNRSFFGAYDQPSANYVALRTRQNVTSMERWARGSNYIEEPKHDPESRLGLIHFAGGVGNAAPKVHRMQWYQTATAPKSGS